MKGKTTVVAGLGLIGMSLCFDLIAVLNFMDAEDGFASASFIILISLSSMLCLGGVLLMVAGGKKKKDE